MWAISAALLAGGVSWTVVNVLVFGLPLHRGIELRSYTNPLEMAIQSAVACSETKDGGLLVSWQLMECVLVLVVSSSLAVASFLLWIRVLGNVLVCDLVWVVSSSLAGASLFIMDESFGQCYKDPGLPSRKVACHS